MNDGGPQDRDQRERRQVELAKRFFGGLSMAPGWFNDLEDWERSLLFQELKSHHSLFVAEGHNSESGKMMTAMEFLAGPNDKLAYDHERLTIKEFERLGLGGRALELMGALYQAQGRSRKNKSRAAEIVMEYGILQDRHGEKKEAYRLFKNSIGRYERSGHTYNLAAAWFNSASVLYDLGRTTASLNACEKGLEIGGEEFLDLRTHLLLQRANCRERTKQEGEACRDYLAAASGYGKLGNRRQQSNILFRVGWLLGRQEQFTEAKEKLHEALRLARELDYAAGLAMFHLQRAQFLAEVGHRPRAISHLRSSLPHAKTGRLDKAEKRGRGLLYRLEGAGRRPLTFYLKAKAPDGKKGALDLASRGNYAHRGSDGYATRVWRDSPRTAGKDAQFLERLLAELSRRANRPELLSQSRAVRDWRRSVRQGKRIL